jgi:hypothetical protein
MAWMDAHVSGFQGNEINAARDIVSKTCQKAATRCDYYLLLTTTADDMLGSIRD